MTFTTPILNAARWIWPVNLHYDIHNAYALFRKEVVLETVPVHAPTLITADQSYHLYVNGSYVCRGPARGYQRSWPCDEIDLARWLVPGRNVIAVQAYNPGFGTFQYLFEGFAGLLFMGKWGDREIVSDGTWRARTQIGIVRDTVPSSLQLFCQEHIDARVEDEHWRDPGYDDSGDGWDTPATSSAWNSEPWHTLEPRGIPFLEEKDIRPVSLMGISVGQSATDYMHTRNVVEVARRESLWHTPTTTFPPCPEHGFFSYLYDFGTTVVGNLHIHIEDAAGGEIIDALYAETIEHREGAVAPRLDQTQVSLGGRLICRAGRTEQHFYHPYGFRYLIIRVREAQTPPNIDLTLRSIGYPLAPVGNFTSSDSELTRIWKACRRTQQVCSLDAYVDTPWREQAQWWGDARVQAWNTFHLTDDVRLLRRGIRCIGRQTTPDGLTYGHAPTIAHHCILPDFTLIWMISLWDDYWQSGSLETFMDAEIQDILQKALAYFEHHSDPHTGLVRYDPRHWLFLDWAPLKKEGHPAILSFWLLYTLDKLATLYTLSEDSERATRLKQWAGRLRLALGNLLDPMDGLYVDGTDDNGLPYAGNKSVHTQTLACLCGVADSDQTKAHLIEGSLLPFVRGEDCPLVKPSVYWCTYVFSVLDLAGYGEDVVRYIRRHWAQMADHGTTWSQMKGYGGEQSHSHAWSAHPLYHLMQIVGGIRQTAPAWRRIEFRPLLWDRSAEITIPTPQGQIEAHWSKSSENEAQVSLHLPAGIEAKVILPGLEPLSVGAGLWQWSVPAGDQPSFLEPQLLSHPPISTSIHS